MPTLKDFAYQYADYIERHSSSPTVVSDIANKIKSISYTKSERSLSESDIDTIVDEIQRILSSKEETPDGKPILEAEDSSKFIDMVKRIRQEAKRK